LRAQVLRWDDEAIRLEAELVQAGSRRSNEIIRAVFGLAVRSHFDPDTERPVLAAFVADMRAMVGPLTPVREAEALIREALGEDVPTNDIDLIPERIAKTLVFAALVRAWGLDEERVNGLLVEAERLAAERCEREPLLDQPYDVPSTDLGAHAAAFNSTYTTLRLTAPDERAGWVSRTYPTGPPFEWWLYLARCAEEEAAEPLLGGRAASPRIFEFADWALQHSIEHPDARPARTAYWTLRLATLARRLAMPIGDLPKSLTPDGATRRALQVLARGGRTAAVETTRHPDDAAELTAMLALLRPAVTDTRSTHKIDKLLRGKRKDNTN
jgi:hypothetical protein